MSALDGGRLAELEAAARAATPGPWRRGTYEQVTHVVTEALGMDEDDTIADALERQDAAHIAAASPDVVLALVAEVREARAMRERVEAVTDLWEQFLAESEDDPLYDALTDVRDALTGAESDASGEVAPGATDDATGPQIAAQDCPDCEWVPRPQRWADMANGVEPELAPGRACARHANLPPVIDARRLADATGRASRPAQERIEGGR